MTLSVEKRLAMDKSKLKRFQIPKDWTPAQIEKFLAELAKKNGSTTSRNKSDKQTGKGKGQ